MEVWEHSCEQRTTHAGPERGCGDWKMYRCRVDTMHFVFVLLSGIRRNRFFWVFSIGDSVATLFCSCFWVIFLCKVHLLGSLRKLSPFQWKLWISQLRWVYVPTDEHTFVVGVLLAHPSPLSPFTAHSDSLNACLLKCWQCKEGVWVCACMRLRACVRGGKREGHFL